MALAYKELEAPLKAYFNYVLTRFPVDVTKLKNKTN